MACMATLDDLDELALAFPGATKASAAGDRLEYRVGKKTFCRHREPRKDALDPETRERLEDVLMFKTPDTDTKAMLLEAHPDVLFTTSHFDGYPAVLSRLAWLGRLDRDTLDDLLVEAWLSVAPKRAAATWLSQQGGRPAR